MTTHSSGSCAPTGWIFWNSGATRKNQRICRRRWKPKLPVQGDPTGGVLRQETVQEGGAAARQARDDERPPYPLVRDPRIPRPIPLQHEAVHQHAGQILARREAAEEVQAGLALERSEKTRERFPERGIAEVVETGPAARQGQHVLRIEAQQSTSRRREAGAAAPDVGPVPRRARLSKERRRHQPFTRKTPTPISIAPAHWTPSIDS